MNKNAIRFIALLIIGYDKGKEGFEGDKIQGIFFTFVR